jgi:hypothetical protein
VKFTCSFCGKEVNPAGHDVFQKVEAWQRPGRGVSGKSGSSLVLRQTVEEFACVQCIVRAQLPTDPNQTTLI